MAERTTIARPYADAAFETAREANVLGSWSEMLKAAEAIAADPQMAEALASPKLDAEAKTALFLSIAGDRFAPPMRNFVRILIEADRIAVVREIRELFEVRKNSAEGVAKALIETAMPLTDAQLADLTAGLSARFGRRVEASVEVNPSLIGGARITVGDTVIDGSVRGKLAAMAQALTA
ncbi:MAG TPA: F0F1 ATP synthase subunit delta [Casimicrobiaceae bacterium]|nr:F0F1 ATP synthase subunit delta [Casimicrobiaceae bacterium]